MLADEQYRLYGLEYYHKGSRWTVDIPATSAEDAQERARQIYYAKVLGTLEAKIPAAVPGSGLFVRALCWFKNLKVGP